MSYAKFKSLGEQEYPDEQQPPYQPSPQPQQQLQPPTNQPPPPGHGAIKVSTLEHKNAMIGGHQIVVVDVYADWCGPCLKIGPAFDILASKYSRPGHCALVKENVDDGFNPSITGVPAFDFFVGGRQVHRMVGADIESVEAKLLELLAK